MKVSLLQTNGPKAWSWMTTKNHLGSIWQTKPQVASKITSRMLSTAYGNTLDTLLDTIDALYLDTDDDYTWQLIGSSERNIPLVAAYTDATLSTLITAADVNIGQGGTDVYLVFPEMWFSDVNVIVGEKNELYPLRVLEDPVATGTNWVYRCQVWGATALASGIPGEELTSGKLFSKDYSPVSDTLSIKGGGMTHTAPIGFRNGFSQIRMQYTQPGNMIDRKFGSVFETVDPSGKMQKFAVWQDYNDWQFNYQFAQEKNRLLYYGRSGRDANGKFTSIDRSGHVIRAGAGIREQQESSNVYTYNTFDIKLLTSILTDLAEGKLAMDERKFVVRTGERGAILINEAIMRETVGWTPLRDENAIKSVPSMLHSNARGYGFQFTEYMAPNNIHVKIEVDPMYSDPVRNKVKAPMNGDYNGGLAESYRMDIGTIAGEPNLRKVYAKNTPDITAYIAGLRDPFNPQGGAPKQISSPKDGYEVHKFATCSAMLKDPTRVASLIPSILTS